MKKILSVAVACALLLCSGLTLTACGGGGGGSTTYEGTNIDSAYCSESDFLNGNAKLQLYDIQSGYPIEIICTSRTTANVTFIGAASYSNIGVDYTIDVATSKGTLILDFSRGYVVSSEFPNQNSCSANFAIASPHELVAQGIQPEFYLDLDRNASDSEYNSSHIMYDTNYNQGMGMTIVPGNWWNDGAIEELTSSSNRVKPTFWGNCFMKPARFTFIRLD